MDIKKALIAVGRIVIAHVNPIAKHVFFAGRGFVQNLPDGVRQNRLYVRAGLHFSGHQISCAGQYVIASVCSFHRQGRYGAAVIFPARSCCGGGAQQAGVKIVLPHQVHHLAKHIVGKIRQRLHAENIAGNADDIFQAALAAVNSPQPAVSP